jgi:competence protein ComEC
VTVFERGGRRWQILATRSATAIDWRPLVDACSQADIAVSDRWFPRACQPRWLKLDRKTLGETGGVAIFLKEQPRVASVAERIGGHPWATDGAAAMPNRRTPK